VQQFEILKFDLRFKFEFGILAPSLRIPNCGTQSPPNLELLIELFTLQILVCVILSVCFEILHCFDLRVWPLHNIKYYFVHATANVAKKVLLSKNSIC